MEQCAINIAREYINTPYIYRGRKKQIGIDCFGLITEIYKEVGICNINFIDYPEIPTSNYVFNKLRKYCYILPVEKVKPLDILLFSIRNNPQHLALYIDNSIIHVSKFKCIEHNLTALWKSRLINVYRLKEEHRENK